MKINTIVLSPFEVNTYVVSDDTNQCIIIDPACYSIQDREKLDTFISENKLTPVALLNTHCHLDHLFGNNFIADKYSLGSWSHRADLFLLENFESTVKAYGLSADQPQKPSKFISEDDIITFGDSKIYIMHIPGHSPGSLVFYNEEERIAVAGDVIFSGSIGRTDLPGGDYDTLINGIKTKLYKLDNRVNIYPGHGPSTTVGVEKKTNPFVRS